MATSNPSPAPQGESDAAPGGAGGLTHGGSGLRPPGLFRFWTHLLVASCLAALVSWLVGETSLVQVVPKRQRFVAVGKTVEGIPLEAPRTGESRNDRPDSSGRRCIAGHGTWTCRRADPAFFFRGGPCAGLGFGLGVISGGAALYWGSPVVRHFADSFASSTLSALLVRASIWSVIGASAGLAMGVGLGGRSRMIRTLLGGALGGMLGAAVYETLGAFLFPLEATDQLTPIAPLARLLALVLISTFSAAAAGLASGELPTDKQVGPVN